MFCKQSDRRGRNFCIEITESKLAYKIISASLGYFFADHTGHGFWRTCDLASTIFDLIKISRVLTKYWFSTV